ncbi:phosphatase PAP2 family protein [Micromonospora soli]|uniref:phosphatase PAP2 family protein n=1 Tax=Micromonospora sp. NBRC 110009 TaxID=3061627 RepID=UPI0026737DC5|nr:phosphatase PAP2 family protein [Micromonospora sp. NBRC 110009]WKT98877.1 phosphatase PAP2 family protein [Micromonospora sp. NBRC 110009]
MILIYVCGVLAVLVPAIVVPWLASRWAPAVAASRTAERLRVAVAGLTAAFGRLGAALVVLLAGSAAVVTVCWPLGEALSRLEPHVDHPVFEYVHARQVAGWAELNSFITAIGDRYPLKWVTVVGALVLAVAWRRGRWWLPLLALPLQFVVEQYAQEILKLVVDRGHPPTDLGSYPSGGCARVLMTFGTLLVLAALIWRIPRRVRVGLLTGLGVLATVEGYTRVYAEKHWLTDVLGGWTFGILLTGVMAFAVVVAAGRVRPPAAPATAADRRERVPIST